eukprot:TRINITY_DN8937_c0_g1_i6.p1 TRINITY_DN8937_c0_g1~~TRINITY_DN8937_c0_g1_i6.p1  ORF type:complete len:1253 (-),score=216.46 TRINITY_DN8937_c0_g1_i6:46-3291(-)
MVARMASFLRTQFPSFERHLEGREQPQQSQDSPLKDAGASDDDATRTGELTRQGSVSTVIAGGTPAGPQGSTDIAALQDIAEAQCQALTRMIEEEREAREREVAKLEGLVIVELEVLRSRQAELDATEANMRRSASEAVGRIERLEGVLTTMVGEALGQVRELAESLGRRVLENCDQRLATFRSEMETILEKASVERSAALLAVGDRRPLAEESKLREREISDLNEGNLSSKMKSDFSSRVEALETTLREELSDRLTMETKLREELNDRLASVTSSSQEHFRCRFDTLDCDLRGEIFSCIRKVEASIKGPIETSQGLLPRVDVLEKRLQSLETHYQSVVPGGSDAQAAEEALMLSMGVSRRDIGPIIRLISSTQGTKNSDGAKGSSAFHDRLERVEAHSALLASAVESIWRWTQPGAEGRTGPVDKDLPCPAPARQGEPALPVAKASSPANPLPASSWPAGPTGMVPAIALSSPSQSSSHAFVAAAAATAVGACMGPEAAAGMPSPMLLAASGGAPPPLTGHSTATASGAPNASPLRRMRMHRSCGYTGTMTTASVASPAPAPRPSGAGPRTTVVASPSSSVAPCANADGVPTATVSGVGVPATAAAFCGSSGIDPTAFSPIGPPSGGTTVWPTTVAAAAAAMVCGQPTGHSSVKTASEDTAPTFGQNINRLKERLVAPSRCTSAPPDRSPTQLEQEVVVDDPGMDGDQANSHEALKQALKELVFDGYSLDNAAGAQEAVAASRALAAAAAAAAGAQAQQRRTAASPAVRRQCERQGLQDSGGLATTGSSVDVKSLQLPTFFQQHGHARPHVRHSVASGGSYGMPSASVAAASTPGNRGHQAQGSHGPAVLTPTLWLQSLGGASPSPGASSSTPTATQQGHRIGSVPPQATGSSAAVPPGTNVPMASTVPTAAQPGAMVQVPFGATPMSRAMRPFGSPTRGSKCSPRVAFRDTLAFSSASGSVSGMGAAASTIPPPGKGRGGAAPTVHHGNPSLGASVANPAGNSSWCRRLHHMKSGRHPLTGLWLGSGDDRRTSRRQAHDAREQVEKLRSLSPRGNSNTPLAARVGPQTGFHVGGQAPGK